MKKDRIKYSFLVFLYAYFRQIDLSLDRSRWSPLSDLRTYYNVHLERYEVAENLSCCFSENKKGNFNTKKSKSIISILKSKLLFIFTGKSLLTIDESCYCRELLLDLDNILKHGDTDDKIAVENLRVKISEFNYEIIEPRLKARDRKKAERVEHFMQNEMVETIELREFYKF